MKSQLGALKGNFVLEKANAGVGDILQELRAAQVTRVLRWWDGGGHAGAGDMPLRTPPARLHLVLGFSSPTARPWPHGVLGLPSAPRAPMGTGTGMGTGMGPFKGSYPLLLIRKAHGHSFGPRRPLCPSGKAWLHLNKIIIINNNNN